VGRPPILHLLRKPIDLFKIQQIYLKINKSDVKPSISLFETRDYH